jgi:DNA-directed RNA polymerase specialized sigma24 family protein
MSADPAAPALLDVVDPDDFLAEHGAAVARVAWLQARSAVEQEDLQQEALLAAVRAPAAFRGECSLKSLALRIAHRTALRHALRRCRLRTIEGGVVAAPRRRDLRRRPRVGNGRHRLALTAAGTPRRPAPSVSRSRAGITRSRASPPPCTEPSAVAACP